ncbi:MAG: HipA domain-containing protein [Hydrogenophaga sp.]|uniref:type II toxin-antitoxin system HipA family toxin n=1 Tax=Hydrogenophaga sp. TaxID=1904254 RepID=UPI00276B0BE4|nr:HipA domain-containing protein [Hydrogenophaga sp.]MDP2417624.1 HipA domain-containing protein [Hydrogenophaga sp.]MDZ4175671.1 HipA domain-containing protein [Hydrogenophaga sp.]
MSAASKKAREQATSAAAPVAMPDGLEVWLDDVAAGPLSHMGRLHRVGADSVRFEYAPNWLKNPVAFALDPELVLADGNFFPKESNFGVFLDSCPDRWGQVLMRRRELVEAKQQGRARRELTTWDFFLGVQDITRMGALRFSTLQSSRQLKAGSPPQFADAACLANQALAAPALTHMGELQAVALELTRKKVDNLDLLQQWLRVLVAPGASLGGARPKANLQDGQGRLWIAKFPAADDEHDWALREMLVHQMATDFGLQVAPARLERIGTGHHTFVTQRFDRHEGRRRFFTSAMALLNKTDSEEASYLDLAEFLGNKQGVEGCIKQDLRELFRRVLFNVATANRDDHLRNHGFIRQPGGWRLAPAYDMNPSTKKDAHVLTLDDRSADPDLDTVMATAEFYRVHAQEAQADLARLSQVLGSWKQKAKQLGLSAEDRLELEDCFQT